MYNGMMCVCILECVYVYWKDVCMYIDMCVCILICVYVYSYVCVYIGMCVCVLEGCVYVY